MQGLRQQLPHGTQRTRICNPELWFKESQKASRSAFHRRAPAPGWHSGRTRLFSLVFAPLKTFQSGRTRPTLLLVQQEKPCPQTEPQPSTSCSAQAAPASPWGHPGDSRGAGRWLTPGQTLRGQSTQMRGVRGLRERRMQSRPSLISHTFTLPQLIAGTIPV